MHDAEWKLCETAQGGRKRLRGDSGRLARSQKTFDWMVLWLGLRWSGFGSFSLQLKTNGRSFNKLVHLLIIFQAMRPKMTLFQCVRSELFLLFICFCDGPFTLFGWKKLCHWGFAVMGIFRANNSLRKEIGRSFNNENDRMIYLLLRGKQKL